MKIQVGFRYVWLLVLVVFQACSEIPPIINPVMPQEACENGITLDVVEDQPRNVLIEEFTGVRCVNCPAGSEAIEDLLEIHGENLIVVSIHAGFFSPPYDESKFDFRTPEGNQLINFIGSPIGYPSAAINRKLFDGEFDLQLSRNSWPGYVNQELEEAPTFLIHIQNDYNDVDRGLQAQVSVFLPEGMTFNDDVNLTVLITEQEKADVQLTPDGIDAAYKHKHIFRTTLTNATGNPITNDIQTEQFSCNSFTITLDEGWEAEQCEVIAFVHRTGAEKTVLQVVSEPVIP